MQTQQAAERQFPTLYTIDSKGKLRSWSISVIRANHEFVVETKAGLTDGAKVVTAYTVSKGKNLGRANETTPFTQAELEAKSKWDAQIRSGYREDPAECKQSTLGSGIPAPMLAQKYSPDGSLKGSKTLEQMKICPTMIHVQPKLDGNRCLARITADTVELFTRKGDRVLPIPHIERQLREAYDLKGDGLGEIILDGELYTDAFSFNTLNGLVRRENKTAEHLEMLEKVKYHVYDVMSEQHYAERYRLLYGIVSPPQFDALEPVTSYPIAARDTNIRRLMERFLSQGYEGLMIRRLDMPYENKRSWGLCKYKDFQDAEYRVVDIVEDVRGGIIGAFVLEIEIDGKSQTFNAGIKDLSHEESAAILERKDEYVGRWATVEFFSLSEYGVPRFPKLKGFRADL